MKRTLAPRREPVADVVRRTDERRAQVSLHFKILTGYVVLAAALVGLFALGASWDWTLKIIAASIVTLVLRTL